MTIAAAFVCSDGIVLAADSEYTYNYSKYEGEKLFQFGNDKWAIGIAAAGTMGLAKMFIDDLKWELRNLENIQSLCEKIKVRAKYFKEEYIRKEERERMLLLLVAIQMKSCDENVLLRIDGDLVEPVYGSEFIGVGDEIARATASWIFHRSMPTNIVGQLALQVLYWTTQHAQFCGKTLYAMAVPRPWKLQPAVSMYEINDFFWGLNGLLRPILMGCIDQKISQERFEFSLQAFVERMRAARGPAAMALAAIPYQELSSSFPAAPEPPAEQFGRAPQE